MDRYDLGEFLGLTGLTVFAGLVWPPAALLVGSLLLLVEVNLRSRSRAPVRDAKPFSRTRKALTAAKSAWSRDDVAA